MDIAELRDVQSRERTTDSLQELPDSFYSDVASYIAELKAERERTAEAADDPFADPDVSRLSDEIQTAEQVAESLYERRVGKIVKQASFAAAGMGGAEDGLTAEEQDLYDDLVERIEGNKARVLDVLAGEGETAEDTETDSSPDPAPDAPGVDASSLMGDGADLDTETPEPPADDAASAPAADSPSPADSVGGESPETATTDANDDESEREGGRERPTPPSEPEPDADAGAGSSLDDERATVRITSDVGEIFGVDERTYTLESEDVVSLPEANAEPLVDKDAATRLD